MPVSLKDQLEAKRVEYDEELTWHRFLLDSYTGAGGYQGRVKQSAAGFWGIAAETYSTFATYLRDQASGSVATTYLDRFPREDDPKFRRRKDVAHYLNYVKPTTLIKIGYICRKPHQRNHVPDKLKAWMDETGYDKEFRRRAIVTAALGWFPMLVDMPAAPDGALTAEQSGKLEPYVVLNLPCHLLDYQLDDNGKLIWAKMGVCFDRKVDWKGDAVKVARYTLWTAADFTTWEVVGETVSEPKTGTHPFKQVPIVPWRADVSVEDPVKAESINASIALEARRLFNLVSELDEHIRSQVFALLLWPGTAPAGNEAGQAGTSDGLVFDGNAKNLPQFLAPPASVAATLETRITSSVIEIYRIAGVEYEKASGVDSSAQSKAQEFEKTNVGISSLAQALARADRETLILVGRGLGIAEETLQAIECSAHASYADEALGDELDQAVLALTLQIGAQAKVELLKRLVGRLLPGLGADTVAIIESEIQEAVDQADKDEAAMQTAQEEALKNPPNGTGGGGNNDSGATGADAGDQQAAE